MIILDLCVNTNLIPSIPHIVLLITSQHNSNSVHLRQKLQDQYPPLPVFIIFSKDATQAGVRGVNESRVVPIYLWVTWVPRRLDIVSSRFCRRSAMFFTVRSRRVSGSSPAGKTSHEEGPGRGLLPGPESDSNALLSDFLSWLGLRFRSAQPAPAIITPWLKWALPSLPWRCCCAVISHMTQFKFWLTFKVIRIYTLHQYHPFHLIYWHN